LRLGYSSKLDGALLVVSFYLRFGSITASRRDATRDTVLRLPLAVGGDERSELQSAAWGGGRLPALTGVNAESDTTPNHISQTGPAEIGRVGRIPDGMRKRARRAGFLPSDSSLRDEVEFSCRYDYK
jgi:hypothetical protein